MVDPKSSWTRSRAVQEAEWEIDTTATIAIDSGPLHDHLTLSNFVVGLEAADRRRVEEALRGRRPGGANRILAFSLVSEILGIEIDPSDGRPLAEVAYQLGGERNARTADLSRLVQVLIARSGPNSQTWLDKTSDAVLDLSIPVVSSPPDAWTALREIGSMSPFVAIAGWSLNFDRPMIAVVTLSMGCVMYLARPTADVLRQNLAQRLERKIKLPELPSDQSSGD